MLYQSAEQALTNLILDHDGRSGAVRLVFNMDGHTVVDAHYLEEATADQDLNLQPAEFAVTVDLPDAPAPVVSVSAATMNAIAQLSQAVKVSVTDRGSLPSTYGTMFEQERYGTLRFVPYREEILGFVHEDFMIHDPTLSQCGRFKVDPAVEYGFEAVKSSKGQGRVLERNHPHGGRLRLTCASNGYALDRFDESGQRVAYAFNEQIPTGDDYPELVRQVDELPAPGM
jgi:hypothetical protein